MSKSNPIISEYASEVLFEVGKELCLKTDMADVNFIFNLDDGSIERVPAHKLLLKAGSDVFRTMFNGTWKEKDEVDIVDVSSEAFKEFLQFFYLGRVKLTIENVAKVMDLGNMYNVAGCMKVCSEFMKTNLNDENVCLFYGPAVIYDQQKLKKTCETIIGFNTNAVLKSSGFLACDKRAFAEILKSNWLSCTEFELFEACISWLKAATKQNNLTKELVQVQLGDSFYDIRFELMLFQEIVALFSTYGNLFKHNIADIAQMIANRELETDQSNGKRGKRNLLPWNNRDLIECNRLEWYSVDSCPGKEHSSYGTTFSTNKLLLLQKIILGVCKVHNNDYHGVPARISIDEVIVPIQLFYGYKRYDRVKQFSGETNLTSGSKSNEFVLPKPILIKPESLYQIYSVINDKHRCKFGTTIKSKVYMKDGITIKFYDDPKGDTESIFGPVHCLFFYPIEK